MFSLSRCWTCVRNDLLDNARLALLSALVVLVMFTAIILYFVQTKQETAGLPGTMFALLLTAGVILPFYLWRDLHHASGRAHYLQLPCSNLERFISRWLVCGPLYLLWAWAVTGLVTVIAEALAAWLLVPVDLSRALPNTGVAPITFFLLGCLQSVAFAGAIRFRRYGYLLTPLVAAVAIVAWIVVGKVAGYLFFHELAEMSGSELKPPGALFFDGTYDSPLGELQGLKIRLFLTVLAGWVLYLAWLALNEHEAQDGI